MKERGFVCLLRRSSLTLGPQVQVRRCEGGNAGQTANIPRAEEKEFEERSAEPFFRVFQVGDAMHADRGRDDRRALAVEGCILVSARYFGTGQFVERWR